MWLLTLGWLNCSMTKNVGLGLCHSPKKIKSGKPIDNWFTIKFRGGGGTYSAKDDFQWNLCMMSLAMTFGCISEIWPYISWPWRRWGVDQYHKDAETEKSRSGKCHNEHFGNQHFFEIVIITFYCSANMSKVFVYFSPFFLKIALKLIRYSRLFTKCYFSPSTFADFYIFTLFIDTWLYVTFIFCRNWK